MWVELWVGRMVGSALGLARIRLYSQKASDQAPALSRQEPFGLNRAGISPITVALEHHPGRCIMRSPINRI